MRFWLMLLLFMTVPIGCDEFDPGILEDVGRFESAPIPLLPLNFPVYPKAFSTESLDDLIAEQIAQVTFVDALDNVADEVCITVLTQNVCLGALLGPANLNRIDNALVGVNAIQDWVNDQITGRLRFYDSGPLSVGVGEQLARTLNSVVEFENVQLHVKVRNRTDGLWAVPIRFSLFMGDSQSVIDRSALVMPLEADPKQGYTFMLQPGEVQEITLDAPTLVAALNDFRSLAIDYDAVVEVTDLNPSTFRSWVDADRSDMDGNGVADALSTWGIVFEDLSITVTGAGKLEVPDNFPQWMQDLSLPGADSGTTTTP